MLPYLLVERKFHPFACVLIEAFEVATIDVDSVAVGAAQAQERFDLDGNVLAFYDSACLLLAVPQIVVHVAADDVLRVGEEGVLLLELGVLGGLDGLTGEEEDGGVPHRHSVLDLDGRQKLQK